MSESAIFQSCMAIYGHICQVYMTYGYGIFSIKYWKIMGCIWVTQIRSCHIWPYMGVYSIQTQYGIGLNTLIQNKSSLSVPSVIKFGLLNGWIIVPILPCLEECWGQGLPPNLRDSQRFGSPCIDNGSQDLTIPTHLEIIFPIKIQRIENIYAAHSFGAELHWSALIQQAWHQARNSDAEMERVAPRQVWRNRAAELND